MAFPLSSNDAPPMIIKDLSGLPPFASGDDARLCEFLNPLKEALALRYSLAHAEVAEGGATKPHRLRVSEVYYLLEGEGLMHIDGESAKVRSGQAVYIPPDATQWIENVGRGPLRFLCIVDPAWRPEDEEVLG
jgi:mannose-6-phosphate isomerase-like protein (cupin superfamily)